MKHILFFLLLSFGLNAQVWIEYENESVDSNWIFKSESGIRTRDYLQTTLASMVWYTRPSIGYRFKKIDALVGLAEFAQFDSDVSRRIWESAEFKHDIENVSFTQRLMLEHIWTTEYYTRLRFRLSIRAYFVKLSSEILYDGNPEQRAFLTFCKRISVFSVEAGGGIQYKIMDDGQDYSPLVRFKIKTGL